MPRFLVELSMLGHSFEVDADDGDQAIGKIVDKVDVDTLLKGATWTTYVRRADDELLEL